MSRRSRRNRILNANRNVLSTSISKSFTLEDLDRLSSEIEIRKAIEIQKAYSSNDPAAILAAASYLQKSKDKDKSQLKSYIFDPDVTSLNAGGFRVPTKGVSFDTLKRMARTPVIRTIVDTRKDQVASFAEPVDNEQERGWMIRRKRTRFSDIDNDEISDSDKKIIEKITKFILDGGSVDNKWDFDGFEEYIRQLANDSLVIDQVCFENVYSRGGELVQYYPVDGATIRLVDTSDTFNLAQYAKPKNGYWPKYCQVWMNDICALYYPWELGYGIRNKTTDIYANGYGQSELEDLVGVVTWILYGMQYNGNFFCISGDSKILTDRGTFHVESLVGQMFQTFDGVKWNDSTAYQTDVLDLYVTTLRNGLRLRTSGKHMFLVCDEQGEIVWKKQKDLLSTDYALINSVPSNINFLDSFNIGKRYIRTFENPTKEAVCEKPVDFIPTKELVEDSEFWEIIGFALGDGHWGEHILQIFPHWEKDCQVFEKARKVFDRHGIRYKEVIINKSHQRSDGEWGYPAIFIYHTTFLDWLYDIGFGKSGEKTIPVSIYNLSDKLRGALLRGWFSADGHTQKNKMGYSTPSLCCVDDKLRQDGLQLLISIGVWSTIGKLGINTKSSRRIDYYQIRVQDVDAFVEKVGYIQDYKNENIFRANSTKNKWDIIPHALAVNLLKKASPRVTPTVNNVYKGGNISRKNLIKILEGTEFGVPDILNYHFVQIFEAGNLSIGKEQLYDIEVFNDEHIFLSDFVAVHNSQGSNPKGFFSIEGAVSPNALEDFKQMWRNTVMGVWNAHKIPVIETGGSKVNWVNMMGGNMKDMEFHKWLEFLITVACCVFRIDPSECGFNLEGMKGIFGQDGQKERLKHSQSKGLTPILKLFQRLFTKYLVEPLDDQFEFVFCGVETEDQQMALDMDVKKVQNGFMSMEDGFKKWSGRDFDPENDTILNSIYFQMQQAKQMGGDAMGMMGGEMGAGQQSDNPFDQYEDQSNPFEKALVNYLSKGIKDEE